MRQIGSRIATSHSGATHKNTQTTSDGWDLCGTVHWAIIQQRATTGAYQGSTRVNVGEGAKLCARIIEANPMGIVHGQGRACCAFALPVIPLVGEMSVSDLAAISPR